MIGIVAAVFTFDHRRGLAKLGFGVALLEPVIGGRDAEISGVRRECLHALVAVETPRLAGAVPGDGLLDRCFAGECRPGRFGQHTDAVR